MDLELFQCPELPGLVGAIERGQDWMFQLRATVEVKDGIADFVSGHATSTLDDINYDEFYRIDDSHSDVLVQNIKATAGARWPTPLGVTVEMGCGTGGFRGALLGLEAPYVLLTDVSPKMLRICRGHLDRIGLRANRRVTFATYSATERCLRSEAFDTCVGTSVVHHIADVRGFLIDLRRMLKPGGRAFFLEPNRRFHQALMATLADIVALYLHQGVAPTDQDLLRIVNWIGAVRCNTVHYDDLEFLATREDKHLFRAEDIEAFGRELGFEAAEALNCGPDPSGAYTASVYLGQCEVSPGRLAEIAHLMSAYQARYFSLLNSQDTSPSYLLYFSKPASASHTVPQSAAVAPQTTSPARELAPAQLMLRYSIELVASDKPEGVSVAVDGWCVANLDVKWVRLTAGNEVRQLPVMYPRLDVQVAINGNGVYPPLNALCSGFRAVVDFPASHDEVELAIDVVLADGSTCNVARSQRLRRGGRLVVAH